MLASGRVEWAVSQKRIMIIISMDTPKETNRKSMTVSEEISMAIDPKATHAINKESDSTTY